MAKIFSMICFVCICKTTKEDDINFLESKLLRNYSSILKPRKHQKEPVFVNISLTIYSVRDVNEKNQFLTFFGFFDISWYDDFLKWNKKDYADVEYVNIPHNKVWTPDVGMYYSFANLYDLGSTPFVTVFSDGFVKWYPGDQYSVDCEISTQKFPFDEQTCAVIVGAWQTTDWMQRLVPNTENTNINTISKNGEWQFLHLSVSYDYWNAYNITAVKYDLRMKRRCLYYLLNIVIPIMALAFLNTFTFLLPCSSGDRIQYSVTLFVAFGVFVTLFQQITPTSSTDMPFLTMYITFHLLSSSVSVITSLIRCKITSHNILNKIKNAIGFYGCCKKSKSETSIGTVSKSISEDGLIAGLQNGFCQNTNNVKLNGNIACDLPDKEEREVGKISPVPFAISFSCLCASTFAFYLAIYV